MTRPRTVRFPWASGAGEKHKFTYCALELQLCGSVEGPWGLDEEMWTYPEEVDGTESIYPEVAQAQTLW